MGATTYCRRCRCRRLSFATSTRGKCTRAPVNLQRRGSPLERSTYRPSRTRRTTENAQAELHVCTRAYSRVQSPSNESVRSSGKRVRARARATRHAGDEGRGDALADGYARFVLLGCSAPILRHIFPSFCRNTKPLSATYATFNGGAHGCITEQHGYGVTSLCATSFRYLRNNHHLARGAGTAVRERARTYTRTAESLTLAWRAKFKCGNARFLNRVACNPILHR